VQHKIAVIKATPIDKELLKKQAINDRASRLKQNERAYVDSINKAEQNIKQAEHDCETAYNQAKLDIEKKKSLFKNIQDNAKEEMERQNILAEQEYETILASIDNTEKTMELKIKKEEVNGQKRRRDIEISLRALKARNNIIEEKKKGWKRFYEDTVEISKQQESLK